MLGPGTLGPLLSPLLTKLINRERRRDVQRDLDRAADTLEEIRRDMERLGAAKGEEWWAGSVGQDCRRDVEEIDGLVSALRRITLPEMRGLE